MSWIESHKTLTGIRLDDAFKRLDGELHQRAYKAITGGKGERLGLTDINPGFLPSVLLEIFGPLGVGWGFEVDGVEVRAISRQRKDGSTSEEFEASARVQVWFSYELEGERKISTGTPWIPGGSDNSEREWAIKGAITNALGTAWFFEGYQMSVYQGLRSHNNIGKQPPPSPRSPQEPQVEITADDATINELALKKLGWAKPHAVSWLKKYFGVDSTTKLAAAQKKDAIQLLDARLKSESDYDILLRAYQQAGRCRENS